MRPTTDLDPVLVLPGLGDSGPRHWQTLWMAANVTMAVVVGCATARPERPPTGAAAGWPESWGLEFGMRCAAAGEDVRFCTCVAKEVQKRWTPEQFRSLGSEGLQDEVRACRERIRGAGAE